jgi:hypothetical protein
VHQDKDRVRGATRTKYDLAIVGETVFSSVFCNAKRGKNLDGDLHSMRALRPAK